MLLRVRFSIATDNKCRVINLTRFVRMICRIDPHTHYESQAKQDCAEAKDVTNSFIILHDYGSEDDEAGRMLRHWRREAGTTD